MEFAEPPALPAFLRSTATHPRLLAALIELSAFAWQQAWSCLFAGLIFLLLGLTHWFTVPGVARYDVLLLACVLIQLAMLATRIESRDEAGVICVFHALGLGMELVKVDVGSWSYPNPRVASIGGVPLFSGFMYAAVASYICQAWRRLNLTISGWPPTWICVLIALAIYGNFIANHWWPDIRWLLFPAVALLFARAQVGFVNNGPRRRMPMLLEFLLIGLFIWFAEQLATFFGAWRYPNQHHGWQPVYGQKLTSWWLLVIVSIVIVAELKRTKARLRTTPTTQISA